MQGKTPPAAHGNTEWRDAAQRGMELTLAAYKWEMVWGAMYLGWEGWGMECSHGICATLPLLCCPAHEKREMEIMNEDARENLFQRSRV